MGNGKTVIVRKTKWRHACRPKNRTSRNREKSSTFQASALSMSTVRART